MIKYKLTALIVVLGLSQSVRSEVAGRVDSTHTNIRCAKREISEESCREKRRKAIARGCVTQVEARLLEKFKLCPFCDWEKDPQFAYMGYCPPGCFVRGTRILVLDLSDGQKKWETVENVAANAQNFEIFSIDSAPGLGKPSISSHEIIQISVGPETEPMVNIVTPQGDRLNVTHNHGVLLSKGTFVVASNLTIGDSIAMYDGTSVTISAIDKVPTSELVYNFFLNVEAPISHTIISDGGLVTGDQYWQDELEQ